MSQDIIRKAYMKYRPIILWIAIVLPTGKNSGLSFNKNILNTTANIINLWLYGG